MIKKEQYTDLFEKNMATIYRESESHKCDLAPHTPDKNRYPAEKDTFVRETDNVLPYPEAIRIQCGELVNRTIYSEWIVLRPYNIQDAPAEIKQSWKKEIDKIIIYLLQGNKKNLEVLGTRRNEFWGDRHIDPQTIRDLLGEPGFDHEQLVLLAIALFMFQNKARYKFISGHLKAIFGGNYKLENFIGYENDANCVDIACLTRELAALFGIEGEITAGDYDHRYFVTDSGRVLDVMAGWQKGGIFNTEEEYLAHFRQR